VSLLPFVRFRTLAERDPNGFDHTFVPASNCCRRISATLSPLNILVDLPITAIQSALFLLVLIRFGLLALAISWFLFYLSFLMPITLTLSLWYAGRSAFVLLFLIALALYAFRSALAGRPIFGAIAVDD